jgi:peptide/nickel transport system permease protein
MGGPADPVRVTAPAPAAAAGPDSPAGLAARALPTWVRILGSLVPGLAHLVDGARGRGATLLGGLAAVALVVAARAERIPELARRGRPDDWIALATLAAGAAAAYAVAWRDLWRREAARPRAEGLSEWALAWRAFRRNRLAVLGLVLLAVLYAAALLTPLLAPYDPYAQDRILTDRFLPPSAAHWMGTDRFGRDIFTRVLYGARISLSIGFIAVGIAVSLGTCIGAVAGYFGRWVDTALMRFVDVVISFPRLVLVLAVVALFEPSIFLVVAVLGLTQWPTTARLVRGEVLSLREREFVLAARALGLPTRRILWRHVVPNTLGPVIVAATLGIGNTILLEAALSFLGLGVQPPLASWGGMVADGRNHLLEAWWIATFPGLAIVFTVVAFNLVGDGLRDALDPRLRV